MRQFAPQVAVGAVIFKDDKVLLVRRKNPPAQGEWAIPGGKVKWGETLRQALKREIMEETNLDIEPVRLLKVVEVLPDEIQSTFHYVILDYMATIKGGQLMPGDDALAVGWFGKEDLKQILTTPSTRKLLQQEFGF